MQFSPLEQFPLHLLAGFQSDGGRQGEGEVDIESGVLPAGADGLDPEGEGCRHFYWRIFRVLLAFLRLVNRLAA